MDKQWISITGIRTKEDIETVKYAIQNSHIEQLVFCNFPCSYKRLRNYAIAGEHSCSIRELNKIIRNIPKEFVGKFGIHFSPNPNGEFVDDCIEYINIFKKYINIEQITIVSLWPKVHEIRRLKEELPNKDIVVQIPIYRISQCEGIEDKIMQYLGFASSFIFDSSGGNGIEHDFNKTLEIINNMPERIEHFCIAGGLNGTNVNRVLEQYFKRGFLCSVDAQSCLMNQNGLDCKKIIKFLTECNRTIENNNTKRMVGKHEL